MRLINAKTYEPDCFQDQRDTPEYAILSHTSGKEEVMFEDMRPLTKATTQKAGFRKIAYTCEQALADGLSYCWVDTCCIDKSNSAELSEAINAMFAYYEESKICYAFLVDVDLAENGTHEQPENVPELRTETAGLAPADETTASNIEDGPTIVNIHTAAGPGRFAGGLQENTDNPVPGSFRSSRWFTRGWTLQELIAPQDIRF